MEVEAKLKHRRGFVFKAKTSLPYAKLALEIAFTSDLALNIVKLEPTIIQHCQLPLMLPLLLLLRNEKKGNDLIRSIGNKPISRSLLLSKSRFILPSSIPSILEYFRNGSSNWSTNVLVSMCIQQGNRLESFMSSVFKELTLQCVRVMWSIYLCQQNVLEYMFDMGGVMHSI